MGKRILYIYGGLYSPNGMSSMLSQKINYLAENTDYELYVVLTEHPEKPMFYQLSDKVRRKDLVVNFDDLDTMPMFKKMFYYWAKQRRFKKLLSAYMMELRADITVSITRREINFINQIKDGSKKISEIHFARTFYRQFNNKHLPQFVNRKISKIWMNSLINNLKQLDCFVVLTNEDRKNWPELNNVKVIPNFISSVFDKKSELTNKKVIAVGRYSWQKGFDYLIDSWRMIYERHPDWALDIYGAGDNVSFQKMADSFGLSDVIHCRQAVPNISEYYANSSIFVLSSRYEGLPLVIIEAMSAGLPVVSFTCPCGPRDIIENGVNGLLVENGNIHQLADRICYLIEHDNERLLMGKNASTSISKYYKERIMQKWIELFDLLLS